MLKKPLIAFCLIISSLILNGQNTLPSCVISAPHNNAYFMEGTNVKIRVYASDLGGTFSGGSISKVEFFVDNTLLGESSTASSNTYSYLWTEVPAGTYRLTAKATGNEDSVFTSAGVIITVGSSEVQSIGISGGRGKYLANIIKGEVRGDFNTYWNGVTAENSCKWGSVEGTRDEMNWTSADIAYNHAKDYHMSFHYHALVWGSQYPSWIKTLEPSEFQEEMEEYIAAVAARYPLIDKIDVLNENMHLNTWDGKEHAEGTPYFREGLGGPGDTGYDWAIWLFEKARFYFPDAKLIINDFELITNTSGRNEILDLMKVLRDRGLIDGIGTQSHHFNIDGKTSSNIQSGLDAMANSGVPIYVTELDLRGSLQTEASQLNSYQATFPAYWNHPAVAGITLWGYVEGETWVSGTGILNNNGSERSAMTWLRSYMAGQPDVGYPFISNGETADTTENILINGEFNTNPSPWQIDNHEGGAGSVSIVSDAEMSGDGALQICLSDPGTASWHVQVSQDAPFVAGKHYEISFIAKADAPRTITFTMQEAPSPYTQYIQEEINLTTENQVFSFLFDPSETDATNKLKFFVGLNTTCLYIDRVIFREIIMEGIQQAEDIQSVSVYPNPVKSGIVTVENTSGEKISSVEILDLKGAMIKAVRPGQSKVEVEISSLLKGMYFVRIHTEKAVVSKKIVIL